MFYRRRVNRIAVVLAMAASSLAGCALLNAPPVALFVWQSTGGTVRFDAAGSHDPDGVIVEYAWEFGDGEIGTGDVCLHSYSGETGQEYSVRLIVRDDDGAVSSARQTVTLGSDDVPPVDPPATNSAPIAAFTWSSNGNGVDFDAGDSSDPDGDELEYAWDFGDGRSAAGVAPGHVYYAVVPQTFYVTVTVRDPHGAEGTSTQPILVEPKQTAKPGPDPVSGDGIELVVSAVRNQIDILGGWWYSASAWEGVLVFYGRSMSPVGLAEVSFEARAYDTTGELIEESFAVVQNVEPGEPFEALMYWENVDHIDRVDIDSISAF